MADWKNVKSALVYAGFPTVAADEIQMIHEDLGEDVREDPFLLVARAMNGLYLQGTLAQFLTEILRTGVRPRFQDEFLQHLVPLGLDWERTTNHIRSTGKPPGVEKERIFAEAKPYEAYREIEKIIRRCRNQLAIMDPWVDEDIFPLYLESVPAPVSIKIITQHMTGKFEAIAKKFSQQRKQFEVRLHDIHDRYIIVDDRAWLIGQSLKDAGRKPLAIIELGDVGQVKAFFDKIWSTGKKAS
ncbi:MAG: hypothetical protein WCC94_04985 [Candidatus Bathyarchaeia archaeon]